MKHQSIRRHALWLATVLHASCSEKSSPYAVPSAPPPPKLAPLSGPSWKGGWSKVVQPYPGFPVIVKKEREWSHAEIAQRHKALTMKELPTYVTELRGSGPIKETTHTSARWMFTVPPKHLPDFERYLLDMGIPKSAFHEQTRNLFKDWIDDGIGNYTPPPPPDPPATNTVLYGSDPSSHDGDALGMHFPREGTTSFSLINPNLTRANILIMFNSINGNTIVMERTRNPLRPEEEWEE